MAVEIFANQYIHIGIWTLKLYLSNTELGATKKVLATLTSHIIVILKTMINTNNLNIYLKLVYISV